MSDQSENLIEPSIFEKDGQSKDISDIRQVDDSYNWVNL